MDTWFTTEPFIAKIKELNLDTIGMLKDCKQEYWYNGKLCKLKALAARVNMSSTGELFGSIVVKTKESRVNNLNNILSFHHSFRIMEV